MQESNGLIGGVVGGLVGGLVGAGIWTAVGCFTGYESGWIAWGIGALTGIGVKSSLKCSASPVTGFIAAAIAFVAVLSGKFAVVTFVSERFVDQVSTARAAGHDFTSDDAVCYMCHKLVERYEAEGKRLNWPQGADPDDASEIGHFPPEVASQATRTWEGMSPSEREEFKQGMHKAIMAEVRSAVDENRAGVYLGSFGLFDIIWMALALSSAFKIASSSEAQRRPMSAPEDGSPIPTPSQRPQA